MHILVFTVYGYMADTNKISIVGPKVHKLVIPFIFTLSQGKHELSLVVVRFITYQQKLSFIYIRILNFVRYVHNGLISLFHYT